MSDDRGDSLDPSEWLARQFGPPEPDEPEEPQEPEEPEEPQEHAAPAPTPDILGIGADVAPPSTAAPAAFDWGFGITPAVPGTGTNPTLPADPAAPPPAAPEPPELVEPPAPPTSVLPPSLADLIEPPAPDSELPGPPAPDSELPGPPLPGAEPPTVAFPWESAPDPIVAEPLASDARTELLGTPAAEPTGVLHPELDALFGPAAFADAQTPAPPVSRGAGTAPRAPLARNQRILLGVAIGLLGVLVLVALFFAGTRLPALLGPAPAVAVSPTPTMTPTPTPTAPAIGPVAAGVHKWDELRGGECLDPFTSVWAETFTVVDCAAAHPAQMVFRGTFPATAAAPSTATPAPTAAPGGYPGAAALQSQISLLCTAPGVIDLAAAGAYTDIQFQGAFAGDAREWTAGQHDYFCFVTRASGQPLTGSVATAPAAG